ncbi:redox-regulated ATPase YchF [Candidatus Bathyarchaeota archaeon]|nr:redox-regulated ATPase YchF [Candidatus Bathyarchaeota archaeon]
MGRLVGIVGKPNVGKSTFFSAATMVDVPIAAYPFTTIKPNRGIGYVTVKCVCKELGVKDEPVNSICKNGLRMIPVELVDCAGLVPGAWQGRGLGNQFLDEVRMADALIHIVDASGGTDLEGRICEVGVHDPLEDLKFLDRELDMWMLSILKRKWESISRRGKVGWEPLISDLAERLSGLGIKRSVVEQAVRDSGLKSENIGNWSETDLVFLVHKLRLTTKPMVIAANKIDVAEARRNLQRISDAGYKVIPCSAQAELALRILSERGILDYYPGGSTFKIIKPNELNEAQMKVLEKVKEEILNPYGSTGVQEIINYAYLKLLGMVVVYPVENVENLTDHDGRVLPDAFLVPPQTTAKQFASMIHSDLGGGFLYATEARSKMRVGEDYIVKDRDILSITSTAKRR